MIQEMGDCVSSSSSDCCRCQIFFVILLFLGSPFSVLYAGNFVLRHALLIRFCYVGVTCCVTFLQCSLFDFCSVVFKDDGLFCLGKKQKGIVR